jgi:capsular polysaccharide biosynthesis protein
MNNSLTVFEEIRPYTTERNWLFAPKTYLLDSWEPLLEEIYLPVAITKLGSIEIDINRNMRTAKAENTSRITKLKRILPISHKKIQINEQTPILDLRTKNPENIAHAMTNHLPVALYIRNLIKCNGLPELLLVFPLSLPEKIHKLFLNLGFDVLLTNDDVFGNVIRYVFEPWISIRSIRHEIIRKEFLNSNFSKKILSIGKNKPKNIFLSRRDSRRLINESGVENLLKCKGFTKVYLEEFDIFEQIAIVALAENIVAIHGAALAPILFRAAFNLSPIKLIEIFSPGHLTNVYRVICHQVGGKWCGIRGKLSPSITKHAYFLPKEISRMDFFWKFGHKDFEIDLDSLESALKELGI